MKNERFNIISISLSSSLPSFNNIHSNNPHSIQTQDHLNNQQQDDDVDSSLYNFQGWFLFDRSLGSGTYHLINVCATH